MKKSILLVFSIFSIGLVIGQSLTLSGTQSEIIVDENEPLTEYHLKVVNTSADTIKVKALKEVLQDVSGSENYFCWDVCLAADKDTSGYVTMYPGDTSNNFLGDYKAKGNYGTQIMKYCFFDRDDITDSVCTIAKYVFSNTDGFYELANKNFVNISPNPATYYLNLNYSLQKNTNANFNLYDVLGNKIMNNIKLDGVNGSTKINVSKVPTGVYFYNVVDGQKVITAEKIIIKN